MFDTISFLIVAGTFLVVLWLSILLARFLLTAILLSMQRGTVPKPEATFIPAVDPEKHRIKTFRQSPDQDGAQGPRVILHQ